MNKHRVDTLILKRGNLRKEKKYDKADLIRKQLISMGVMLQDAGNSTTTIREQHKKISHDRPQYMIIFGSGELSSQGRAVHEYVLQSLQVDRPHIVIISSPAGFQPNVIAVCEEIRRFFKNKLQNFHPKISIVYANTREDCNYHAIIDPIRSADYLFMGPGSPTYTIHVLQDTAAFELIQKQLASGVTMAVSSAAAIAFSRYALPVYEIYKVGRQLYWEKGLNIYSSIYQNVSIIPHCNNTEGGDKVDTSYCYMGKTRFRSLRSMLPHHERLIGIDEHTALIINIREKTIRVKGKGTIRDI